MRILNFIRKNSRWFVFGICLLLFIFMLVWVLNYENIGIDRATADFFVNIRIDGLTEAMKLITFLGSAIAIIIGTFLFLVISKDRHAGLYMLFNVLFVTSFNNILKIIIERPRPMFGIISESGFSFPSGHAMMAVAFYGFCIYYIWKYLKNNKQRWFICGLLSVLIMLICISRIYLAVHYTTDVIAGVSLSLAYLIILISVMNRKETFVVNKKDSLKKKKNKN